MRSVAFINADNTEQRLEEITGLHKVWSVGMGCMLTKIDVFKQMPQPWFQYVWNNDTQDLSGEDIYFCNQVGDYGYEVFVDADISQQVAHLGTKAFLLSETHEFI